MRHQCPALAALVSPVQNMFFSIVHFYNFWCPHRPTCWADSRAGSPVSYYVSLVATVGFLIQQCVSYTLRNCDTKLKLNYCKRGSFLVITKFKGDFLWSFYLPYSHHCFFSRDPKIPLYRKDAGIEPRTVATLALTVRRFEKLYRETF